MQEETLPLEGLSPLSKSTRSEILSETLHREGLDPLSGPEPFVSLLPASYVFNNMESIRYRKHEPLRAWTFKPEALWNLYQVLRIDHLDGPSILDPCPIQLCSQNPPAI